MKDSQFRSNNHFVSRGYLKRWAGPAGKCAVYRILVSHAKVPEWRPASPGALAYHRHLYTSIANGSESDEIERWLEREFETPAEEPLRKATSGAKLKPADWRCLVRFLALHDVRTPARLLEQLRRSTGYMSELIEDSMRRSIEKLHTARETGEPLPTPATVPFADRLPFRVTPIPHPSGDGGWLKGEALIGRGLWLFGLQHTLTSTIRALLRHRWTILLSPPGVTFFTSDNPVLRLNYNSLDDYTLDGGWGSKGTDIMMPISPKHLLFTQVGHSVPARGTTMPPEKAALIRRFIAEKAHRQIYALEPDAEISHFRKRIIDPERCRAEREEWERWPQEQAEAERRFRAGEEV